MYRGHQRHNGFLMMSMMKCLIRQSATSLVCPVVERRFLSWNKMYFHVVEFSPFLSFVMMSVTLLCQIGHLYEEIYGQLLDGKAISNMMVQMFLMMSMTKCLIRQSATSLVCPLVCPLVERRFLSWNKMYFHVVEFSPFLSFVMMSLTPSLLCQTGYLVLEKEVEEYEKGKGRSSKEPVL